MPSHKIEQGIDRFVKYIHRMSKLNDDQLKILLKIKYDENPDYYTSIGVDIEGHIREIRSLAMLNDDGIRSFMRKQIEIDPIFEEICEDGIKKKAILDMSNAAKDMKADPRQFARRIDEDIKFG